MRKHAKLICCGLILFTLLPLLGSCEIVVRPLKPTQGPPPPPGSACAAVSTAQLQTWMDEKLPRIEEEVVGGVVYLGPPQVTNCLENTVHFQVRIGYQAEGLLIELALMEDSVDLAYYPDEAKVCLDLHALLASEELSPQGIEEVGQEIKVAEMQTQIATASPAMPAETRQQLDQALGKASLHGDPQTQGIGPEAAGILLGWAADELMERFNGQLAGLIGACIPTD